MLPLSHPSSIAHAMYEQRARELIEEANRQRLVASVARIADRGWTTRWIKRLIALKRLAGGAWLAPGEPTAVGQGKHLVVSGRRPAKASGRPLIHGHVPAARATQGSTKAMR